MVFKGNEVAILRRTERAMIRALCKLNLTIFKGIKEGNRMILIMIIIYYIFILAGIHSFTR